MADGGFARPSTGPQARPRVGHSSTFYARARVGVKCQIVYIPGYWHYSHLYSIQVEGRVLAGAAGVADVAAVAL